MAGAFHPGSKRGKFCRSAVEVAGRLSHPLANLFSNYLKNNIKILFGNLARALLITGQEAFCLSCFRSFVTRS